MKKTTLICVLATAIALALAAAAVSCGDDDDDDSGGGDAACSDFCNRLAECDAGGDLGIDSLDQCLSYCDSAEDAFVDCVREATSCGAVQECVDAAGDDDDDSGPAAFDCEGEGLAVRDFVDAEESDALYATAADFTVQTTDGPWNLAESWTGCETYLIIPDVPQQNRGWSIGIWERDVDDFLAALPANTQVFFVSTELDEADREANLETIQANVAEAMADYSDDEVADWSRRLHYVTEYGRTMDGWWGEQLRSPRWGVGVDRFQRLRYIGSFADYGRYDGSQGWFAPNLSMAANEAIYYNFESDRQDAMDAENADVYTLFDGELIEDPGWAGQRSYATVTLPSASELADYDTMEFDLYLGCDGDGEYGTCPPWDYLVYLYLCENDQPETCTTEVGRWITTYHREGRWVHDVSGLLPLLSGGETHFAFYSQQPYDVTLTIRLSDQGRSSRPQTSTYLFAGGSFGPTYNDKYDPVDVAIPADATKVEIASVISGHGGHDPGNCAEFCDTSHHFYVNGTDFTRDFPSADIVDDCMSQVDEGTVPNQYGTWWYGRMGWCPGKEVPVVMTDVTSAVTPGETATFDYEAFYNGEPYPNDGPTILLDSWVVISK